MLLAQKADGAVLLERRAERGVWGGLWCPPQFANVADARQFAQNRLAAAHVEPRVRDTLHHAFTHFELDISPLLAQCDGFNGVMEGTSMLWYNPASPERLGLPAPVTLLMQSLT